jgi:hypothetical protein
VLAGWPVIEIVTVVEIDAVDAIAESGLNAWASDKRLVSP